MKKKPLCKLCRANEAAVPDREKDRAWKRSVCRQCHGERLRGDLKAILDIEARKHDPNAPSPYSVTEARLYVERKLNRR